MLTGDIKRIAAPGRRGRTRRRKFRGDGLVEGIDYQPGDPEFIDEEDDDEEEEVLRLDGIRITEVEEAEKVNAELAEQARSAAAAADLARREEEQRAEEEFVNAERIRLDQVKRERESDRIRIEAEDAEEQRQLMLAISAEKSRREEDRLRLLETARLEREREAEEELIRQREREVQQERETVVDDASSEMARKAEVQRLKREAFLKDMNAFSQTIEEEAERAASGRRAAEERSSGQYARSTVPISTSVNPFDESPPQFNYETENNSDSENVERSEERTEERTARFEDEEVPGSFNELTSSLFAANASTSNSVKNRNTENNKLNDENIFGESEDYSRISRAGNLAASQINGNKRNIHSQNNENTNMSREGMRTESPPHDDEEEEGMGGASSISNILTIDERKILSPQQKVAWRALQADLTTRRKEFHGAVTYAFDGIFSWQMYGSTEATEEGKAYTEYLMRCQWGTTWDNMQPWIVARRYREFDVLNFQLRRSYPSQASVIHTLPEKDFFRQMDASVVDKRRRALEDYVTRIVQRLPTVLRSRNMDEFLGIAERIATIRALLGPNASLLSSSSTSNTTSNTSNTSSNTASNSNSNSASNNVYGSSMNSSSSSSSSSSFDGNGSRDGTGTRSRIPIDGLNAPVQSDGELTILSVEAAERVCNKNPSEVRGLDEDSLSRLEEDVKDLGLLLRIASPLDIVKPGRLRDLLRTTTTRWPALRCTALVGVRAMDNGRGNGEISGREGGRDSGRDFSERDFSLVPRALQVEEDLVRIVDDYRSLVYAGSLM